MGSHRSGMGVASDFCNGSDCGLLGKGRAMKTRSILVVVCATAAFACVHSPLPCRARTYTVAKDGSGDFDSIQEAIDYSWDGDIVEVWPGTYTTGIKFNGRAITLTSTNPDDSRIVATTIIAREDAGVNQATVTFDFGENHNSVLTGFTIIGGGSHNRAVEGIWAAPTISRNIITGYYGIKGCEGLISNNIVRGSHWGIYTEGRPAIIYNNTIVDNSYGIAMSGPVPEPEPPPVLAKNNIIAHNGIALLVYADYAAPENSFNCFWNNVINLEGDARAGVGDFIRDPLFADYSGHDYHLQSAAGRWSEGVWVIDAVDSPGIDAGDPCDPVGMEPVPNGGRMNIGAYGGTAQASKTLPEPALLGDADLNAYVDDDDLSLLLANWGTGTTWGQGDFDASGSVNDDDLSLLLAHWNEGTPPLDGSAVPEPATLALLAIGGLALIRLDSVSSATYCPRDHFGV